MIHFISSYGKNVSVGFAPLHVTILNKALFVSLFSLLRKSNTNLKSTYHLDIVATSSNGMCASLNTMSNFAEKKNIFLNCTQRPTILWHCPYCMKEKLCSMIQVHRPVRKKTKITIDKIIMNKEIASDFVENDYV